MPPSEEQSASKEATPTPEEKKRSESFTGTKAKPKKKRSESATSKVRKPSSGQSSARTAAVAAASALTRLYNKQASSNLQVQAKLTKDVALPTELAKILHILNQFDQTNFAVLWLSTNFTLFYHEYCMFYAAKGDKNESDSAASNSFRFRTFSPVPNGDQKQLAALYQSWKETFEGCSDLSQANLLEMVRAERSKQQLQLFLQAFHAVWLRDFQKSPPADLDLLTLLRHLFAVFKNTPPPTVPETPTNDSSQNILVIRHVLVTFIHMASKDYELITRNLK